ncbi:hypothetical protein QFC21_003951 [Naganishia friedmannii]|uniref:Uncharacterized protein n=1 Tax=Naganishia friedmannii TaxID=89922 RepID=A0ACC2VM27_9TREE|nr:hypothetical protein QFC21_003951 [Naganishia friedmannii]
MEEDKKKKGKEKDGSEDDDDLHSGLDSFKTVQHYAEDTKTCRHVAICRYFGEKIDETDASIAGLYCQKMCDIAKMIDHHYILQICAHPEKVALRATHLTEDVVVASQVPKRKECNLDSFAPVNSVNFYNLDVRQALAAESSPRPSALPTLHRTGAAVPTPPPPPSKFPPRIQPIPQVNPYAAAVSASMSMARRPFGLSTNPNRSVPMPERQPNTVIVEDLPSKPTKKMKTVEASPYVASPSLAGITPQCWAEVGSESTWQGVDGRHMVATAWQRRGYETETAGQELVSAIENASAWNALLTRRDPSDDTEDDEVLGLRALEKNILAYCCKAAKRIPGGS